MYTIQCATPTFNPVAGTYSSAQTVTISTATSGASIRYTTNGTTPSSTVGTVYSSAVSISVNTTLMAIAYESGLANSAVASGNYYIQCAAPTFNPAAGTLWLHAIGDHLYQHQWRDHALYHGRQHAERKRRHGVQQPGEHLRHQHAERHRLFVRHGGQPD